MARIGAPTFPGGSWGDPIDGHVQAQLCASAPAGVISQSFAWIRRDTLGATQSVRMAVYNAAGTVRYGFSDTLVINDANSSGGTFVWTERVFTWSTPATIPNADVVLALQFSGGTDLEMGATSGGGNGTDYDGYTFASGAPATLSGGAPRTYSFPLSAEVTLPDTTAPAAPSGLTAVAGALGTNQITLDWNNNAEGDLHATPYLVERKTGAGGTYAEIAQRATSDYIDTGLADGTTYYYRIRARDNAPTPNISSYSAEANATTPLPPQADDRVGSNDLSYPATGVTTNAAGIDGDAITIASGVASGGPHIANGSGLVNQTGFCFELWIYMPVVPTGKVTFVCKYNAGLNDQYGLETTPAGVPQAWIHESAVSSSGATYKLVSGGTLQPSRWHRLALDWDGTTLRLYVDDTSRGTPLTCAGPAAASNAAGMTFGYEFGSTTTFSGRMDEAAYYGHSLSAARHAAHYNNRMAT